MCRLVKPQVTGWITVVFADHSIPTQRQWGTGQDVAGVKKFWQTQVVCGVVVEFEGKQSKQSVNVLALILASEKTNTLQRILG